MVPLNDLQKEMEQLRLRLEEAEETLQAIRSGQVDALVVTAAGDEQIFVLKSADQPYRLLVEQMREGAATLSPEGSLLFCNRYLADMLARPPAGLLGTDLEQFIVPADKPVFQGLLRAALGGSSQGELRFMGGEGQWVPVHLALSSFLIDAQAAITLVATDLTEQKRNQEVIAAQRLARSILDQASDAIVTCDMSGRIIGANFAALALAPDNPVGLPFSEAFPLTASLHADTLGDPPALEIVDRALAGQNLKALEASFEPGTTAPLELLVAASPLLDTTGRQLGCVVTRTDITERKRSEAAERSARAAAEAAADRLARLQAATAEFAAAQTSEAVVAVVMRQSSAPLGCEATLVELISTDGQYLEVAAFAGPEPAAAPPLKRVPLAEAGVAAEVIAAGNPLWLQSQPGLAAHFPYGAHAEGAPEYAAVVCLPLQHQGERLGLIRFGFLTPRTFEAGERQFMLAMAGQCAQALERARLYAAERQARLTLEERVHDRTRQLRALAERLETLREDERLRISREIHDQLGGQLTGLKIDISQIRKRMPKAAPELHQKMDALSQAVDATVQVVRRIASDLRPGLLDDFGLLAAIEWELQQFQRRTEIAAQLAAGSTDNLNLTREQVTAVFRVLQEALTNVMRHAQATQVVVALHAAADALTLTIDDDGRGIDSQALANPKSLGLLGMQERIRQVGGEVTIQTAPRRGTRLAVRVPLYPPGLSHPPA